MVRRKGIEEEHLYSLGRYGIWFKQQVLLIRDYHSLTRSWIKILIYVYDLRSMDSTLMGQFDSDGTKWFE